MISHEPTKAAPLPLSRPFLPLLLVLFIGSGCSALIYEIVWLQLLQSGHRFVGRIAGHFAGNVHGRNVLGQFPLTAARLGPIPPTSGLCFPSNWASASSLWPWSSACLPSNIFIPFTETLDPQGSSCVVLVPGLCLLPPTLLMGATLPAIARWVETTPQGVSWLGFFYGGNIAGAVFGCLLAGFYLLRLRHGHRHLCRVRHQPVRGRDRPGLVLGDAISIGEVKETKESPLPCPGGWTIYLAIALSGMAALGGEVVWTRLLSLLMGGTVYTFSIILAVFLIGLGIGSSVGAVAARGSPRAALGFCQMFLTLAIAWTAWMISESLPYWPIDLRISESPRYTFHLDLGAFVGHFAPGVLVGHELSSGPGSGGLARSRSGETGWGSLRSQHGGRIVDTLAFSQLVIPLFGTLWAERMMMGLACVAGVVTLIPLLGVSTLETPVQVRLVQPGVVIGMTMTIMTGVAIGLACFLTPIPWGMVAYGRYMSVQKKEFSNELVAKAEDLNHDGVYRRTCPEYVGEGRDVSVVVSLDNNGVRSFHRRQGAGLEFAHRHAPAAHAGPHSRSATQEAENRTGGGLWSRCDGRVVRLHPDVERIVICDIEPMVPKVVTPMFNEENYYVVDGIARENPHRVKGKEVEVIYDDGRHFLRTTKEKFDVITSDPIDPWVKGCAALNTVEYYQMCKEHLNPGGVVSLWFPFYESNLETTKSLMATFFKVFPQGILWSNDSKSYPGYDAILFGQVEPTVVDLDELEQRLKRPDHKDVLKSLRDVGFGNVKLSFQWSAGNTQGND